MGPEFAGDRTFANKVHAILRELVAKRTQGFSLVPFVVHVSGIIIKVELFPNGSGSNPER